MLSLSLTRKGPPPSHLRASVNHLLETVLAEAGLPAPLRVLARSYFGQASEEQLIAIVDTLEQVVVELRKAQSLDEGGGPDESAAALPAAGEP